MNACSYLLVVDVIGRTTENTLPRGVDTQISRCVSSTMPFHLAIFSCLIIKLIWTPHRRTSFVCSPSASLGLYVTPTFLPRDALRRRALHVRCGKMSVCHAGIVSKSLNVQTFSPSSSHTILVFQCQTLRQYFDGDPLTGRRMQGVRKIVDQYLALSLKLYKIGP